MLLTGAMFAVWMRPVSKRVRCTQGCGRARFGLRFGCFKTGHIAQHADCMHLPGRGVASLLVLDLSKEGCDVWHPHVRHAIRGCRGLARLARLDANGETRASLSSSWAQPWPLQVLIRGETSPGREQRAESVESKSR